MISYAIVFIKTNLSMILIKIIIEIIKCDLIRQRVNHSMSIIQIDINKRKSENKQRYTIKGNSRGQGEIIRIHHVTGRTKASVYHLTVPQSRTIRKHMLLMLLEDSIEYKKASQTRKHICKAFTRPKSFQTVVFLDWSRCWKSGSLLCVYPPDDRRRCRPSNECTEPDIENNDTNEEKRTNYKEPEERERKQRKVVPFAGGFPQGAQSRILPELESLREICYLLRSLFMSISILFLLYIVVAVQYCPMKVLKEAQLLKRLFNCELKEHSSVLNLNEYQRNLAEILCTDM